MKRKTAVKMLMTMADRNTANDFLTWSNSLRGMNNKKSVLSFINAKIRYCRETGHDEEFKETVKLLNNMRVYRLFAPPLKID